MGKRTYGHRLNDHHLDLHIPWRSQDSRLLFMRLWAQKKKLNIKAHQVYHNNIVHLQKKMKKKNLKSVYRFSLTSQRRRTHTFQEIIKNNIKDKTINVRRIFIYRSPSTYIS